LGSADPLVLPNLLDAYRNSGDEAVGRTLVKALEGIESSLGTVGSQRVREVVSRFPSGVRTAARPLLVRIESGRNTRLEKIRRLEPALQASGDTGRGREIFFGAKAGCSSCHTIGSDGGHVGPDLTSIGAIRSPHDLLEAIVLPSESFVPGHEVYRVETAREVYSGVLKSRTDEAVLLITGPGDEVRVPRKEIVKMGHAPVSLMPEGFDEVLTLAEMSDLLAFLRSQTSRQIAVEITRSSGGE
jgi:putative heme-binding domain-containing protein